MQGKYVAACLMLIFGSLVNVFGIYALFNINSRHRVPRSEKVLLLALGICGVGTAIFCNLPTLISVSDTAKSPTETSCEVLGLIGIIFMSASAWLTALLSLNRYFIIARGFRNRIPTSYVKLVGIQTGIWLLIICTYVTMQLLVEAQVGVREETVSDGLQKTGVVDMTTSPGDNFPSFSSSQRVQSLHPNTADSSELEPNANTSLDLPPAVAFIIADSQLAIRCGPNWTRLFDYLLATLALFYLAPLAVVVAAYFLITRIAYRQVRQIRSVSVMSSVSATHRASTIFDTSTETLCSDNTDVIVDVETVEDGVQEEPGQTTGETNVSELLHQYIQPILHLRHRLRRGSRTGQRVDARKRKSTIVFIIVIALFLATWTPYYVFFLVEAVSYKTFIEHRPKNDTSDWKSPFSFASMYVMTCMALIGRTWSIIVVALLNRPYRRSMLDLLGAMARSAKRRIGVLFRKNRDNGLQNGEVTRIFSVSENVQNFTFRDDVPNSPRKATETEDDSENPFSHDYPLPLQISDGDQCQHVAQSSMLETGVAEPIRNGILVSKCTATKRPSLDCDRAQKRASSAGAPAKCQRKVSFNDRTFVAVPRMRVTKVTPAVVTETNSTFL